MTTAPERPRCSLPTPAILWALGLALALALLLAPGDAGAAPALTWSAPAPFDAGATPTAISCASESLCVAVDHQGDALSTTDPGASGPSWSKSTIDPGV